MYQVGDHATGNANDVNRCRTEVVVPHFCSSPHLVVLQQVGVHEHTQLSAVAKGRNATVGFGIPLALELNFQLLGNLLATI